MFHSWLCLGGNEIGNNARALGYATSADCRLDWIVDRDDCEGLREALGDQVYELSAIEDAPWFDPDDEATRRFYGCYILEMKDLASSTRVGSYTEGILDGGVPGSSRHAGRTIRVRAWLSGAGMDGLEAGMSWLNAALEAEDCGMHGGRCGAVDASFFTACPPARALVPDFTPWRSETTNLFTNPSFEAGSGTVEVRRNLALNPLASPGGGGFISNGTSFWTVTKEVVATTTNPQGILSRAKGQITPGTVNNNILSAYSIDGLGRAGTPARMVGAWFYSTTPGVAAKIGASGASVPLATGIWTWVTGPIAADAYASAYGFRIAGNAADSDVVYVTGVTAVAGADAPTATIAPGAAYPSSSSPDPDLTPSWTGTPDASESILTGVPVAGVTLSGCVAIRSTQWKKSGNHSLRLIKTDPAIDTGYALVQLPALPGGAGDYTALITRYQDSVLTVRNSGLFGDVYWNPVPQDRLIEGAPNVPGETEGRRTSPRPTMSNNQILLGHGAGYGESIWFDCVGIFEGIYNGPWFDGNSDNTPTETYAWTGAENASTSTKEVRDEIIRPQTDEEYDTTIAPLMRHLHDVVCISGPLEIETRRSADRVHWGRLVEFTLYAGKPFLYSETSKLPLMLAAATVIQDAPFNTVPVPSAELPGAAVIAATNYATNPSVESNTTGWGAAVTTQSGSSASPYFTSGRSTELAAVGSASFRARVLGNGSTSVGQSEAVVRLTQSVSLTAVPAGARVSFSIWGALLGVGGSGVTQLLGLGGFVEWLNSGGTTLGTTGVQEATDAAGFGGRVFSFDSVLPPAGATTARCVIRARFKWGSSATPANNSDVRVYADALTVSVP